MLQQSEETNKNNNKNNKNRNEMYLFLTVLYVIFGLFSCQVGVRFSCMVFVRKFFERAKITR